MKCDLLGLITHASQDCKSGYYQGALEEVAKHIEGVRKGLYTVGQFAAHYHLDYEPGSEHRSPAKIAEENLRSALIAACSNLLEEKHEDGSKTIKVIDARPEVPTIKFAKALEEMTEEISELRLRLKTLEEQTK